MAIRTGIGGWTYPDWRKGTFYPEGLAQKRELEWASRQLGAIEINGTYHSLQKPESLSGGTCDSYVAVSMQKAPAEAAWLTVSWEPRLQRGSI